MTFTQQSSKSRIDRLNKRLATLAATEHADADARRLTKRFHKHAECIFTFLDYDRVPFETDFAERQIRPVVILSKNSQSSRSEPGAATQAILMNVYRILRLRSLNPTDTQSLRSYALPG